MMFAAALLFMVQDPLDKVELAATPIKLLDDRLTLRMPEGSKVEARGHGIMGAPQPNTRETRVVWTSGDRKLVVMAYELFRTAGKDFEAQVRKEVGSWGLEADLAARDVEGLRVCTVTPRKVDAAREAVYVLSSFAARKDGTVQNVSFYFNPKAAEDLDGCRALARKAAETIRAGERALAREAGARVLLDLDGGKQCVVDLPEGFTVTFQKGPDFRVATVIKFVPLGDASPSFNAYFGHHPGYHHEREEGKPEVEKSAGTMLGQAIEWRAWTMPDPKKLFKEAILAVPGADGLLAHVFLVAPDAASLQEVEVLAGKFRVAEKK